MQSPAPAPAPGDLASQSLLSRLTMRPLKALCATHGVDHGLAGKRKDVLVDRLQKIRKVTVGECEALLPTAAANRPAGGAGKGAGRAKADATMRTRLEAYFASGGDELKCSACRRPLSRVQELRPPHGHGVFLNVACGFFPQCKRTHKLREVYLLYKRLLSPRGSRT